ncbi:MAG TPA: SEC-C metal-binding domain-containing protein [Chloroflexota bacterium]
MIPHVERSRPPGRNDPCPCGSGKKFKRCCLLDEALPSPVRHVDDVMAEVYAIDALQDAAGAIRILEEARCDLHAPDLDRMLVERYLSLPAEEAETAFRRWWEAEHDRFSGAGLAQILAAQGRKTEALQILTDSQGPEAWPDYWRLLGVLRDEQGDTQAAVAAMELYTRICPEAADAWMQLADMQQRAGQNDRALVSLRRAGDAAPDSILPRVLRVRILADDGRWREVRDFVELLLEERYDDADTDVLYELRDLLAQAYFVLGDFAGARHGWETLLAERPSDAEARYHLAGLERLAGRFRRSLQILDPFPSAESELRVLDLRFTCLLVLREYDEAAEVAQQIDDLEGATRLAPLVEAAQAVSRHEYSWALQFLDDPPPERHRDAWNSIRLACVVHLGAWNDVLPTLKAIETPDDGVLVNAALAALAAGKLDLAERLTGEIDDQQSLEARSLSALLGPLRQYRRAAEVRRQQQVDQAEKQRRALESRELRRQVSDLQRQNETLSDALNQSETAIKRLLELVGVSSSSDTPLDWEAHFQAIAARAHRDAVQQERKQAEERLRAMLGGPGWERLSESVRTSLREGERLFLSPDEDGHDYGTALMGYARGLESAFKEAIFAPARAIWQREPGAVARLQDESHDPSLGPFVRYLLQGGHLTLGSMAAALERMSDVRRQGIAISLLRCIIRIHPADERALADWKRTAERLGIAADARNRPAHAATVSWEEVREFRELSLGTDGLLRALGDL